MEKHPELGMEDQTCIYPVTMTVMVKTRSLFSVLQEKPGLKFFEFTIVSEQLKKNGRPLPSEQSLEGYCPGVLEKVLEMVDHLLGEANPQCYPDLCHVLCDGHTMAQCSLCHVSQSMSHC